LFPRRPGRTPDLDAAEVLPAIGRALGRWHALGARQPFVARPGLTTDRLGWLPREQVLTSSLLDPQLAAQYADLTEQLLTRVEDEFDAVGRISSLRLHGDCHLGNLLLDEHGPIFVDLDDCMQGPAIQDLWMFLAGDAGAQQLRWQRVMEGYQQFFDFDYRELRLVESLRTLRMIHHVGWIVSRWDDPAFPRAFPYVAAPRFWEGHLQELREQTPALDEPPILAG
jgi:Ser/Thr protein kinase RdoA (MazF antagonist)